MDEILNHAANDADDQILKAQAESEEQAACDAQAESEEQAACDAQEGCAAEPAAEEAQAPEKKKPPVWAWAAGAAAVVAIVLAIIFAGHRDAQSAQEPTAEPENTVTESQSGEEITEEDLISYTAQAEELDEATLAVQIASCGGKTMDNRALNLYYWQQYYTFASNYSSYLSYLIDSTKGLDEQLYSETETWQQAFMSGAAEMFHSIAALNLEADEAGFTLSEDEEAELAAIPEQIELTAEYYGFESGLSYLQASFGPAVTVEDYVAFARDNLRASSYLQAKLDALELTQEEISAFYDENAESYEQSRVLKVDKPMVDVRHILIIPAKQNEDGTYTDEAWQQAESAAQELLEAWKAGEASEDAFAALAGEHSEDPGSATNGGLYTDVYPGQMVEPFETWCFDDARKAGDTGIVKTDYGYHIMYYVGAGEEVFWVETARGDLLSQRAVELEDAARERFALETDFDGAAIFDVLADSREAAQQAAQSAEESAEQETVEP